MLQKGCFSLNDFIHIFADEEVRSCKPAVISIGCDIYLSVFNICKENICRNHFFNK